MKNIFFSVVEQMDNHEDVPSRISFDNLRIVESLVT